MDRRNSKFEPKTTKGTSNFLRRMKERVGETAEKEELITRISSITNRIKYLEGEQSRAMSRMAEKQRKRDVSQRARLQDWKLQQDLEAARLAKDQEIRRKREIVSSKSLAKKKTGTLKDFQTPNDSSSLHITLPLPAGVKNQFDLTSTSQGRTSRPLDSRRSVFASIENRSLNPTGPLRPHRENSAVFKPPRTPSVVDKFKHPRDKTVEQLRNDIEELERLERTELEKLEGHVKEIAEIDLKSTLKF